MKSPTEPGSACPAEWHCLGESWHCNRKAGHPGRHHLKAAVTNPRPTSLYRHSLARLLALFGVWCRSS